MAMAMAWLTVPNLLQTLLHFHSFEQGRDGHGHGKADHTIPLTKPSPMSLWEKARHGHGHGMVDRNKPLTKPSLLSLLEQGRDGHGLTIRCLLENLLI